MDLFKRGAFDASSLVSMGFDALHLTDTAFCESCLSCYGAASVVSAFLKLPGDAVLRIARQLESMKGVVFDQKF